MQNLVFMATILIIDDHPLVLDGITTMLKDIDFLTIAGTCKTGSDAIAFLRLQEPDIILLDINLPDMTGLDLCTLIRKKKQAFENTHPNLNQRSRFNCPNAQIRCRWVFAEEYGTGRTDSCH